MNKIKLRKLNSRFINKGNLLFLVERVEILIIIYVKIKLLFISSYVVFWFNYNDSYFFVKM